MTDDNVTDLTKYLPDAPSEEEAEGLEEFTIEEVLTGFAQGLEILRLGILDLDARLSAVEEYDYERSGPTAEEYEAGEAEALEPSE